MQVIITAVGPDNVGLADPLIHYLTGQGANIAEIQMYDHDEEAVFAMLLRIQLPADQFSTVQSALLEIGRLKQLSVRVWSPEERADRPRLAICTTYRPESALAVLRAVRDQQIRGEVALMLGNRNACRGIAEQFGCPWHMIGDASGRPDEDKLVELLDQYEVDYVVLARYMRVLPGQHVLEVCGRTHHELASRPAAKFPWHSAVSRSLRQPNANLRCNVPLHCP